MRLLQLKDNGEFILTKDIVNNTQPYAILSHTWGDDDEEVNFKDLAERSEKTKAGYRKILFCAEQAARDGLRNFWVDTCCIDKSNNTELSEAINSMFRWYRNATICYVYLSDVSTNDHDQVDPSLQSWQSAFRKSRWFTRGWTLQELLAPPSVEFFCSNGRRLGNKESLKQQLHEITRIAVPALQGSDVFAFSAKERMSWAVNRETKREEDKAYSLLGLFGVNMALIYGEGEKNALNRLLEEVYRHGKKRQRDEVLQTTHKPIKRLKSSRDQPSAVASSPGDLGILDPEPLPYSEYSVHKVNATKQSLIQQLHFDKIDERLTSLSAAQQGTCQWFLTKPEYLSWHDVAQQSDHGGFFWIKGNPGTGKSTLMKFLFEEAKFNAKGNFSQITLSFFFLARGTIEEKSTTGLYRSLLHQLFGKAEELKESLEWMTDDGARIIQQNGWHEETLKQTLAHAVNKLGSRSLTLFVDALDECDTKQTEGIVCFFEELCDRAREARARLRICFSSRHYPTIVIQKGVEVTLEDEIGHKEDIEQYIKLKLKVGNTKQGKALWSEILEKSYRIFLWVVLVVDILNFEFRNGSAFTKIRQRLKEIPPKLTDLFEMILTRDGENLERLQIYLKWVLFATRPLKPQELYFAIQLCLDKECSGYWDQEDIELDQMKTFVRSSSKGLAEVSRSKVSEVQFIHESVRDFLLGKYEGQWSGVSGNFVGHSHEILKNCCLAQLNASISQNVKILDPLPKASKTVELRETISLKFPFLEYSVLNVLRHANGAQQNAIEQRDFLADFPLQRWIFLNNTLARYDIRRYTKSVSILYILAEKNLADLIRTHPQRESCFDIENERYGPPIFAALATGSHEAVQTFLEVQAEIQPQEPLLHYLCKQYSGNKNERNNFGRDFIFSQRRGIVSHAAEQGDEVILTFLCALGKLDVKSTNRFDRTPLSWAAEKGHEAVVKLLLENGAELETKRPSGRTPLSWAAEKGHEAVVKLLLENGAELETKSSFGQTPLSSAAANGREAIVKILLDTGKVSIDSKDQDGRTPLSWAAGEALLSLGKHEAIVEMLLDTGKVSIDSKDQDGRTPLSWAAVTGREAIVKMLLDTGKVDVDSKDKDGRTPLLWAKKEMGLFNSERGGNRLQDYQMQLKLLEQQNKKRLLMAKRERDNMPDSIHYVAIVKMLLDTGKVSIDSKDRGGRTPLSWAAANGHEAVVKMLLDTGKVSIDSKDQDGRTPLSWAAGEIPLSWAAVNGHKAVAKLLLENGAKESQSFNPSRMLL